MLFYFLHAILCPWTHKIADFAIVARGGLFWISIVTSVQLFCDVTRTRVTGIVTSNSSIVLARANWRKGDLNYWIITMNIDFAPPGIHGLAYFMSWVHNSTKNNYRSLISLISLISVSLRTVFPDLALWRHHGWSVTSRKRVVLVLWRNIHRLFLHVQMGANAIFTSE